MVTGGGCQQPRGILDARLLGAAPEGRTPHVERVCSVSEAGSVPAGRPTIYDVADRAGVSKSLVSLVLRGSDRVSPARRDAVLTAIRELGYRPSQAATVLASRRTRAIEVVIDDYRNLWFVDLLDGLRAALTGQGYRLSVTDRAGTGGGDPDHPMPALAAGIDGLVVARDPDGLLTGWHGPTVIAGWRSGEVPGADRVANDDEAGARLAVEHLLGLGHRRIGHLSGAGGSAEHRRKAFAEIMARADTPVMIASGGDTTEGDGYRGARWLLDRHPGITGIYAANDSMALGALAALRDSGLSVPGDISLVGYDDSPLAQSRFIDLTSVDDKSHEVGEAAGRSLLARIEDPDRPAELLLIEPSLVTRGSSGPVPSGR
jgi:DNA-binding LacI/PurR family transcriptional regulator